MKTKMNLLAAALALACSAPVMAETVSDPVVMGCINQMAEYTANNIRYLDRKGLPSFECFQHYYGSSGAIGSNINAFGVTHGMAERSEYDAWALMIEAYRNSDAYRIGSSDYGSPIHRQDLPTGGRLAAIEGDPLQFGRDAARRNYEKVRQGFANVIAANPWKKTAIDTNNSRQSNPGCGQAQEMTVAGIKDPGMRKAAQKEYDRRCGAEAKAAEAKAKAEWAAKHATQAPRIIEVSELEEPFQGRYLDYNELFDWTQNPELAGVVVGDKAAPQGVAVIDMSSDYSKKQMQLSWPAIRDGKASVKLILVDGVDRFSGPEAVALMASETPTVIFRDWVLSARNETLSAAVKRRLAAENKAAQATAKDKGVEFVPVTEAPVSPERLEAAKAAIAKNNALAKKAGITHVPFGAHPANPDNTRVRQFVFPEFIDANRTVGILVGIPPKDLLYEPEIFKSARERPFLPSKSDDLNPSYLTKKICAAEGSKDCWMGLGEKRGWW